MNLRTPLVLALALLSLSSYASSVCPWITGTLAPNYRDIINRQPKRTQYVDREAVRKVLRIRPSECGTSSGEARAEEAFRAAVESHSGRVGAILPLTGRDAERGKAYRKGIEAALGAAGKLLVRDSTSTPAGAEQGLVDLLFKEDVTLIIAGGGRAELDRIMPWADNLLVPILVLGPETVSLQGNRFAFRVYPSEKRLGMALAAVAQQKGLKRISILRPDEGQSDRLIKHFLDEAKRRGLETKPAVFYRSGDAASLDRAVRTLFQIDPKARAEEMQKMTAEAEQKAKERGLAFDARSVILKPIVETDAILLPDHFRVVRHFTKLMSYHGSPRIPLLGPQSWRSSAILEPPEPMLLGSIFADFMGSYDALPEGIRVPGDGYFAEPSLALEADFSSIAFRAGRVAEAAVASNEHRRKLPDFLAKLSDLDAGLYGPGSVFTDSHDTRWPVFLFTIGNDKLDVAPMILP